MAERKRYLAGGFFMVPIVAIAFVNFAMRPPQANQAAPIDPPLPFPVARAATAPLDAKTQAAVDRMRTLEGLEFGATPLSAGRGDELVTVRDTGPVLPALPQFTVGAIIASSRGNLARIDGAMYRVGDPFAATWVVKEIDAVTRSVTIEEPASGRTVTTTVEGPM